MTISNADKFLYMQFISFHFVDIILFLIEHII